MGILRTKHLPQAEQFTSVVNDEKLRLTLVALADKYSAQVQAFVYQCYQDDELASIYRGIRASGDFEKGGKSKVRRKILEFPNGYVYDFANTVMTSLYGRDWLSNKKALRHELIRPWWVVNHL